MLMPTVWNMAVGKMRGIMNKEQKKQKRDYCRENHICYTCGGMNSSDYLNCDSCRDKIHIQKKAFIQKRIDNKLCIKCGKPVDTNGQKCRECADKFNQYNRMVARSRVAKGVCSNCGGEVDDGSSNCKKCKAYFAQKATKYRQKRSADACSRCGHPLDDKNYKTCSKCRAYNKDIYKTCQENGICPSCGKEEIYLNEKICLKCKERMAKSLKEYKEKNPEKVKEHARVKRKELAQIRFETGLCIKCGNINNTKYKNCPKCLAKMRKRDREKKYGFRINRDDGKCWFCGKPTIEGMKVCELHHKNMIIISNLPQTVVARKENAKYWT